MSTALPPRPRKVNPRRTFAIVASGYNPEYVQAMVDHAAKEILAISPTNSIELFQVPGAFEIPVMVQELAMKDRFSVIIALGVIIRGSTGHADLIATSVTNGLQQIALQNRIPVINEVLLLEDEEQARERCMEEKINRGTEAARAAVEVAEALAPLVENREITRR